VGLEAPTGCAAARLSKIAKAAGRKGAQFSSEINSQDTSGLNHVVFLKPNLHQLTFVGSFSCHHFDFAVIFP